MFFLYFWIYSCLGADDVHTDGQTFECTKTRETCWPRVYNSVRARREKSSDLVRRIIPVRTCTLTKRNHDNRKRVDLIQLSFCYQKPTCGFRTRCAGRLKNGGHLLFLLYLYENLTFSFSNGKKRCTTTRLAPTVCAQDRVEPDRQYDNMETRWQIIRRDLMIVRSSSERRFLRAKNSAACRQRF